MNKIVSLRNESKENGESNDQFEKEIEKIRKFKLASVPKEHRKPARLEKCRFVSGRFGSAAAKKSKKIGNAQHAKGEQKPISSKTPSMRLRRGGLAMASRG